jgi:teichuronic acid biosynthesis glycosyltransferase TuaC
VPSEERSPGLAESAESPGSAASTAARLRVLVLSTVYPNAVQPHHGIFVQQRVAGYPEDLEVRAVAPQAWFPFTAGLRPGFRPALPRAERLAEGDLVLHPRFLSLPAVGKFMDGALLAASLLPGLLRLRRDFPFDVIDAHFGYPEGPAAVLLGRFFRVPVVLTLRGLEHRLSAYRLRRPQFSFAVRGADRVVAVSEDLRAAALAAGAAPERVRTIPNGVDTALFKPGDRAAARRSLGLAAEGTYLLTVGSLSERKGAHLVLEALGQLADRFPSLRYLIVGGAGAEGDEGEALRRRAGALGVSDRVVFAGPRSRLELPDWYNAADLFVLPSSLEGCPNVVVEALACGTPVVATAAGGIPQLLADPETGMIVPRRDAEAVAASLAAALARPWDRSRVSARASARSWQVVGREQAEEIRAAHVASRHLGAGRADRQGRPEVASRQPEMLP